MREDTGLCKNQIPFQLPHLSRRDGQKDFHESLSPPIQEFFHHVLDTEIPDSTLYPQFLKRMVYQH